MIYLKALRKMKIAKAKFIAFESLRVKGSINMLDIEQGTKLTGLTKNEYIDIIRNYSKYCKKFIEK